MKISNTETDQAFQSNNNSNFQMDVNGFRISIFFGPGAYVNDRDIRFNSDFDAPSNHQMWGTDSAEVRIWNRKGDPIEWSNGDTVVGFCSSDTVAKFIACLAWWAAEYDPTDTLHRIRNAQD